MNKYMTLVLAASILAAGCSREKASTETDRHSPGRMVDKTAAPQSEESPASAEKTDVVQNEKAREHLTAQFAPSELPGRLLEYRISLVYRTEDLVAGRNLLYDISAKRGFLRSSHVNSETGSMQVQMAVRVTELYQTLQDLDHAGSLLEESISVIDHTENHFIQTVKAKREDLRMGRKSQALTGNPTAQNWAEREASLDRSEDQADDARIEQWKIQDRVQWATVDVRLQGPEVPLALKMPPYRDAFVGAVNLLLRLVYGLIWGLPVLAILTGLFFYRSRIAGIFRRKGPSA